MNKNLFTHDSKMPSTFIRDEFNHQSIEDMDGFVKELISDYENAMYEGWTVENKANDWFVAPFHLDLILQWEINFHNKLMICILIKMV
ncbi:hypothetical protein [Metamycoplasma hominis]|uniref:hypothetical protein n=1 Tax=Metamycoplasma hominis TaxID=2098 RepID=UPI001E37B992|nr:hypothetical protein [Metamycoplasma hominis]